MTSGCGNGVKSTIIFLIPASLAGAFTPRGGYAPRFGGHPSAGRLLVAEDEQSPVSDVPAVPIHDNDSAGHKLMGMLYKAQVAMAPDFFDTALPSVDDTLTAFHQDCVEAVAVGPSTIPGAGNGLFARRDLERGKVVSLYPVHATGINFFDDGSSHWLTLDAMDDEYFFKDAGEGDEANYLIYLLGNRPPEMDLDGAPFVDANPNRSPQPGWLTHYVNDGAIIESNSEQGVIDYLKSSDSLANCAICPFGPSPLLAAITTTDVKKGDELFTSYGSSYWLDALCSSREEWPDKTDPVLSLERELAETMFLSMDRACIAYGNEVSALEYSFEKMSFS